MDIAKDIRNAFVASSGIPASPAEIEHVVQRRLFFAFAAFVFVLTSVYAVIGASAQANAGVDRRRS